MDTKLATCNCGDAPGQQQKGEEDQKRENEKQNGRRRPKI